MPALCTIRVGISRGCNPHGFGPCGSGRSIVSSKPTASCATAGVARKAALPARKCLRSIAKSIVMGPIYWPKYAATVPSDTRTSRSGAVNICVSDALVKTPATKAAGVLLVSSGAYSADASSSLRSSPVSWSTIFMAKRTLPRSSKPKSFTQTSWPS